MPAIGPKVRALFGRHEYAVAELYRRIFVDLDALVADLSDLQPTRILEIGCGEGQLTNRIATAFPGVSIVGIDVSNRVGRLYRGQSAGVHFRHVELAELVAEGEEPFDLVLICDVLHHVPTSLRRPLLSDARRLLAPTGTLLFKDWERRFDVPHWVLAAADMWITGDDVNYCTRTEMRQLLKESFPGCELEERPALPPWKHNAVFRIRWTDRRNG